MSSASREIVLLKDFDGNELVNAAGQRIDPPHMVEAPIVVLTLTKNVADFGIGNIKPYLFTANSDVYYGEAAGRWLCTDVRAEMLRDRGVSYYRKSITLHLAPEIECVNAPSPITTWDIAILNTGSLQVVGGKLIACQDAFGQPTSTPQLLTTGGVQQTDPLVPNDLRFRPYKRVSWAAIL